MAPRRAAPFLVRLVAPDRARDRLLARPAVLFRDRAAGLCRARRVPFRPLPAARPTWRRPRRRLRRRRLRLLLPRPASRSRALRLPASPRRPGPRLARQCLRFRPRPRPTRVRPPPRRRRRLTAGPRRPSRAVPIRDRVPRAAAAARVRLARIRLPRVRDLVPAVPRAARKGPAARVRVVPVRVRARRRPDSAARVPDRVLATTPSARRRPAWAPPRPGATVPTVPTAQSAVSVPTVPTVAIVRTAVTGATGVRVLAATGSAVRVPAVLVTALRVPEVPVRVARVPAPPRARAARVRVARVPRLAARVLAR
jgi:hypothetical protein